MDVGEISISRESDELHLPGGGFSFQGEPVWPNGKLTYRLSHGVYNPLDIPP